MKRDTGLPLAMIGLMASMMAWHGSVGRTEPHKTRTITSSRTAAADPLFINAACMRFALIPAGTFMMGSAATERGRDRDETLHRVTISRPFYMQTTEVTQGQWQTVMGNNPSHFKDCGNDCPVENVSWHDVQRFVRRLSALDTENTYRLPTESEWEYAARAGSTTAFWSGEIAVTGCDRDTNLDRIGWYCGNSGYRTHPVARKAPNSWGLFDMHGNVWEWCRDWYGDYPADFPVDPRGPHDGRIRANRGGGHSDFARFCRSANRIRYMPFDHTDDLGFRLVMMP